MTNGKRLTTNPEWKQNRAEEKTRFKVITAEFEAPFYDPII